MLMDPIERMSLQENIDYYGFHPPRDSNVELVEVDGLIQIKTPTNTEFNWWE